MTKWEETPLTKPQKAAVDRAYTMLGGSCSIYG